MGGFSARRAGVAIFVVVGLTIAVLAAAVGTAPVASAATTTLNPVADASVNQSTPTTRYGTNAQLIADGSPVTQSFLRFDLRGVTGTLQSARLRLHVADTTSAPSPAGGRVAGSANTTWSEATVTWNTRPTIDATTLATLGAVSRNTWVEVDVTAAVKAGSLATLALSSTNTDGAYYDSREATNKPQLVVTTATTTTSSSTTTTTTTTQPPPSSVTFAPTADAYVEDGTPTTNYGTSTQLAVDASPVRELYLRFDLSSVSGSVQSAKLRLHVANISNGGSPAGGNVARLDDTTWSETGVNWNNRPTTWQPTVATLGAVSQNTWVESDVSAAVVTGGPISIGLRTGNTDGAYYDSREAANAPQLVVTLGPAVPPVTGPVVAAVGDMVCTPSGAVTATACRQVAVSNLLVNDPNISSYLALGDLQYDNGELANFQTVYEASYGRVKAKTHPIPGNHEYNTAGATGYYAYFGAAAGDPAKGYYSFDVGSTWHVVGLNANCSAVACAAGSTQEQWLRADLAASTRPCTIAFWHQPRFSSGSHGNDATYGPFWNALQQYGTEIVLNGHEHDYERFAPQLPTAVPDPNGIREFIVGTGGKSMDTFGSTITANSVVRLSTFGLLELTLGTNAYSWKFVHESGAVLDSGTGTCH